MRDSEIVPCVSILALETRKYFLHANFSPFIV